MGPTDVVVSWTLAGKPADAGGCMAHGAAQIFVNMSGTVDPASHQSTTVDCSMGSVTFPKLLVQNLGTPYVEGTLLDAMGKSVAIVGVDAMAMLGTTNVTLAFFGPQNTGGSSSTASSSQAASSGMGGASTTSSSSTSASSAASSSATSSSSSSTASSSSAAASSSSSTGGPADAGGD
jgi:hypothetical protein